MTTILLIRHGENNMVGKRLAGRLPNVHLNARGKSQAQQLAQALCKAPIKAIYSSPLERAVETAEPLAQALGLPVQMAPGVIELAYGDWQGKTLKELGRRKLWKVVQEKPSEMRFPNGESFIEVQNRTVAQIEQIAAAHDEKDLIAIFSHGDIIRLAVGYFLGMPMDVFQRLAASPASISVIHLDKKGRPAVLHVNQVLTFEFHEEQKRPDPAGGRTDVASSNDVAPSNGVASSNDVAPSNGEQPGSAEAVIETLIPPSVDAGASVGAGPSVDVGPSVDGRKTNGAQNG
jgi:probable phosphomutase (TIGR03848 family)